MDSVREGSRWRHARPSAEEVAEWFKSVRLDDGMDHADYVSGVVLIPTNEKVKKQTDAGMEEVWEMTWTPYVRVDTRIAYFRRLAELRGLIAVIGPVQVPRSDKPAFENLHMPDGFWFCVMGSGVAAQRFLCCTMRVALYDKRDYLGGDALPLRLGEATKAVSGSPVDSWGKPELNGLAKAETSAVGRALGMAGILVVGTGVASADDMAELGQPQPAGPTLPEPEGETSEQLNEKLLSLQAELKPHEEQWRSFAAWWQERQTAAGWKSLNDAPLEVRRGMATKMEGLIQEALETPAVLPSVDG